MNVVVLAGIVAIRSGSAAVLLGSLVTMAIGVIGNPFGWALGQTPNRRCIV